MKKPLSETSNTVKLLLVVALVAGLLTGLFIFNAQKAEAPNNIYSKSELIELDGYSVVVNDDHIETVEEPNSGTQLTYMVVDISIKNKGDKNLAFIPVFQTHVRTIEGVTYEMSPLPGINPIYAGDISPSTAVSGELSYLIPDVSKELFFFFDPGWNQENAIFVEL